MINYGEGKYFKTLAKEPEHISRQGLKHSPKPRKENVQANSLGHPPSNFFWINHERFVEDLNIPTLILKHNNRTKKKKLQELTTLFTT